MLVEYTHTEVKSEVKKKEITLPYFSKSASDFYCITSNNRVIQINESFVAHWGKHMLDKAAGAAECTKGEFHEVLAIVLSKIQKEIYEPDTTEA